MELSSQVLDLINQVYAANRQLALTDDGQRQLARMVAEQVRFSTGDKNWGVKAAGPNRPQGPSQIAYNTPGGPLVCWRCLDGVNAVKENGVLINQVLLDITTHLIISVDIIFHLIE